MWFINSYYNYINRLTIDNIYGFVIFDFSHNHMVLY